MKPTGRMICETELYKLYKRKDTWIFLSILLVPLLYAVGLASGSEIISYSGKDNITAFSFIAAMFQMAQAMFIFNVILVAVTARTLGTEIEDKSLLIYLNKIGDRKRIYAGKIRALVIYSLLVDAALIVIGFFCCFIVLGGRTDIVSGLLYDENVLKDVLQIAVVCGFWLLTIFISMMLSVRYKMVVCLGIYMIGYIALNLLSYAKVLKYVSPLYYVTRFTEMEQVVWSEILMCAIYYALLAAVCSVCGSRVFQKKDL